MVLECILKHFGGKFSLKNFQYVLNKMNEWMKAIETAEKSYLLKYGFIPC